MAQIAKPSKATQKKVAYQKKQEDSGKKVNDDYKRQAYSSSRICQGYICSGHGRTVRVRIRGDRGYLTIKGPSNVDGISRYEFEKEITLEEAEELMKLCEPGLIDKTRYLVKSGNHTFEVDDPISSDRK